MLHLPGLVWSEEIDKATNVAQKIHLAVRGLYGEEMDGTTAQAIGRAFVRVLARLRGSEPPPVDVAAVAIEAFHKASLVHDDIEDDDAFRYGVETLHRTHGTGVAINVGDYRPDYRPPPLLGEHSHSS